LRGNERKVKFVIEKTFKIMETQTEPRLRGAALFRKMLDNKKLIQAQAIEDYKNNPELQEIVRQLRAENKRQRELKNQK
jgi:hypothetical protein